MILFHATAYTQSRISVRLDTLEAAAALHILESPHPAEADWQRLFATEGYQRLMNREHAMGRPFSDSAFRVFLADTTTRAQAAGWRTALDSWSKVDIATSAAHAFRYLPGNARIHATIYPSIKPKKNTFVFEGTTNPAIFFYLDPTLTAAKFDNILTHELHHLGVAAACGSQDSLPKVLLWLGGFAEGRAVLAAAGNPNVHPHATSGAAERAVWDRDYRKVPQDMKRMEAFFTLLMDNALSESEQNRQGMQFINTDSVPQGPFYTVGYAMSSAIEEYRGRAALVASTCDERRFLLDYQAVAVTHHLPRWSAAFVQKLKRATKATPQRRGPARTAL